MSIQYLGLIAFAFLMGCKPDQNHKTKRIRVSGEGIVRAMPDQIVLNIDVSFTKPRMADAVGQTQQTVDTVLSILERYGKKGTDINTSSISADKEYNYTNRGSVFVGYRASQSVDFILNDINKFTELTGKILATKISRISSIRFKNSKADSLLREADLLAYDDGLKSAQKLSNRGGAKLGALLFVSNTGSGYGGDEYESEGYAQAQSVETFAKGYGGRGFTASPRIMEFKRTLVCEYELKE